MRNGTATPACISTAATRFAQSAVDRVFFDGDDRAALAAGARGSRRVSSGFTVCMLSTRQFEAVFGELAGGQQAMDDRFAGADEAHVVARREA